MLFQAESTMARTLMASACSPSTSIEENLLERNLGLRNDHADLRKRDESFDIVMI